MAAYPCQRCDQRFEGNANNAYLTLFDGDIKAAFRYILCAGCRNELADEWVNRAMWRDGSDQWNLPRLDRTLEDAWVLPQTASNGRRR